MKTFFPIDYAENKMILSDHEKYGHAYILYQGTYNGNKCQILSIREFLGGDSAHSGINFMMQYFITNLLERNISFEPDGILSGECKLSPKFRTLDLQQLSLGRRLDGIVFNTKGVLTDQYRESPLIPGSPLHQTEEMTLNLAHVLRRPYIPNELMMLDEYDTTIQVRASTSAEITPWKKPNRKNNLVFFKENKYALENTEEKKGNKCLCNIM